MQLFYYCGLKVVDFKRNDRINAAKQFVKINKTVSSCWPLEGLYILRYQEKQDT